MESHLTATGCHSLIICDHTVLPVPDSSEHTPQTVVHTDPKA